MQVASVEKGNDVLDATFTVVIPAYNEEERIGVTVHEICEFIDSNKIDWQVIVSADGRDRTAEIVSSYSTKFPFVTCLRSPTRSGKGAALKRAIKQVDSKYLITMDADGSMSFKNVIANLRFLNDNDVLIFSRYFSGNHIPPIRKFLSAGYNVLVRAFLRLRIRDTQSGYIAADTKHFVRAMNKVGVTNGFYYVILYYYLTKGKARIREIPTDYVHDNRSKFSPVGMVIGGAVSLFAFMLRHSRFYKYVPKGLISLYYRKLRWI